MTRKETLCHTIGVASGSSTGTGSYTSGDIGTPSLTSSLGFYFGAIFFIIGSFSFADLDTVGNESVVGAGECMKNSYEWLVLFTYLVGNVLWQPAVYFQVLEAMNHDYEAKYEEWFLSGKVGKKPRYRWIGIYWWSLEWWGGMCYFIGVIGYNTASIVSIIAECTYVNADLYDWIVDYNYIGAGILFLFAGGLYIMAYDDIWLVSAIFIPLSKKKATSLMWWALWTYWWGGVLFCMSGIFLYWYSDTYVAISLTQYAIETAVGFGGGAVLFHIGALLLLMRQARGRCRPSFAQIHSRYDPTAPTKERREEGATAKGIPQGFTKQAHYPNLTGANVSNPDIDSAHGPNENNGYHANKVEQV
ncbi:hypothetical protein WJX73_005894 [Symbiochloris irregularis]|uniref:Uncharacterized protein n=1 Tax=Symbiochloris irregularis TaxID=706552 RepID=A0AAW1NSH6_9CHLO